MSATQGYQGYQSYGGGSPTMLAPGADAAVSVALMTMPLDITNLTLEHTNRNTTRLVYNFPALAKTLTGDALRVFRCDGDIRVGNAGTELMQPVRMSKLVYRLYNTTRRRKPN